MLFCCLFTFWGVQCAADYFSGIFRQLVFVHNVWHKTSVEKLRERMDGWMDVYGSSLHHLAAAIDQHHLNETRR